MQGPPKRKGSGSHALGVVLKRTRWEDEVAPPTADCSPTASGSAIISGVHTATIHGGAFNSFGSGSVNTIINHNYGPQVAQLDVLHILRSLFLPNFRDIQLDTHAKATEGTCVWFTNGEVFLFWIRNGKILWGVGIPGAGKTILSSIVINCLEQHEAQSGGTICVAYVYLRYSEPLTVDAILQTFVKQILERHEDLLPVAASLYARHNRDGTSPRRNELVSLLDDFVKYGKTLLLVLDALDELRVDDRPILLRLLASLNVRIFITSRPLETLQQKFSDLTVFDIAAQPSDIQLHIEQCLLECPDLTALLKGTDAKERIVEAVYRKSNGMFLHAKLQLEALRQCISVQDVEDTLEEFPQDIQDIYSRTWDRILVQPLKHVNLAKLIFLWILYAEEELEMESLRRAVAINPPNYTPESNRMVPAALIISVCCGLVALDPKSRIVRLIHYTTRDAILPLIAELCHFPHAAIAYTCMAHLTSRGFQHVDVCEPEQLTDALKQDPLLKYAHAYWHRHVHQCAADKGVKAATNAFLAGCSSYPGSHFGEWDLFGPYHVAAYWGFEEFFQSPAHYKHINDRTASFYASPLMLACYERNTACAMSLLSLPGIDVNARDRDGWTALMLAVYRGNLEVVRALLRFPGTELNTQSAWGESAFSLACKEDSIEVVEELIVTPGLDLNTRDGEGLTALIHAIHHPFLASAIVKLVSHAPGFDVNAQGEQGLPALIWACEEETFDASVVEVLLSCPRIRIR